MKQIVFTLLFAALLVACNEDSEPSADTTRNTELSVDLTQIRIKERPGEMLKYVGAIGRDFDTALDSLRKRKSIPSGIKIIKEPLEVLFDYDNRLFFGIVYGDCGNYSDVLDTKGNYYQRSWYCPDENNVSIQEEPIFKENKIFAIGKGGSSKIAYQGRIGYDFDSALDSLIRKYEPKLTTMAKEGHYSGEGFNIAKEKMNIDFSYDSREFFLLTISDKANIYQYLFTGDVIDEKGNYFKCMWAED